MHGCAGTHLIWPVSTLAALLHHVRRISHVPLIEDAWCPFLSNPNNRKAVGAAVHWLDSCKEQVTASVTYRKHWEVAYKKLEELQQHMATGATLTPIAEHG